MDLSLLTISPPLVASTFGLIFLAELPDKTALASLVLATRYSARPVILGAWLAFVVQTLVAVVAGSLLQLLPAFPVRLAAGIGFLVFAFMAARRDEEEEEEQEAEETEKEGQPGRAAWLTSFLVVFAAEWGDLTQLATAATVAQTRQPLSVGIGAILALWSVTIIAATVGAQLGRFLSPRVLKWVSVVLFFAVGVVIIISAFADL